MRIIITPLLFLFLVPAAFGQSAHVRINDLDDDEDTILKTLFNARIVMNVNDDDTEHIAVWKPNFAEAEEFNVSFDSMCYTNIDTIMKYHSNRNEYALIVFATYNYVDSDFVQQDCHACAPDIGIAIFEKQENGSWSFERMKKHLTRWGSWGDAGDMNLRKIGEDTYALDFSSGYGGQGVWEETTIFYELQYFQEIFSCQTHEDNSGTGDKPAMQYDWDKKIEFVPGRKESGYYDLIVTKSGRGHKVLDDYDSPVIRFSGKELYKYDNVASKYVSKK